MIYISRDGQQFGPYTRQRINTLLSTGELDLNCWVWQKGLEEWIPLSEWSGVDAGPAEDIYLSREGRQLGPYSLKEIEKRLADGRLDLENYWAWREGLAQWIPLAELPGLPIPEAEDIPEPPRRASARSNRLWPILSWPFRTLFRSVRFLLQLFLRLLAGLFHKSVLAALFWLLLLTPALGLGWIYLTLPEVERIASIDRGLEFHVRKSGDELEVLDAIANLQISLGNIPDHLIKAVIASEDRGFYEHIGISWRGLGRAFYGCFQNLLELQLDCEAGGSTITQQLVKLSFFHFDRSPLRKIKEIMMAIKIERHFDKNRILTMYLNRLPLGRKVFGIEVAARTHFQKHTWELNLYEAAIIAGAITRPSVNNFSDNPDKALRHADKILDAMVKAGHITEQEKTLARQNGYQKGYNPWTPVYYRDFWEWIKPELNRRLGDRDGSFIVVTSLNAELQLYAERAVDRQLARYASANVGQAALAAMDPYGAVYAMVGGSSREERGWNRAVQARRQPGSAFKPFIYLAALEQGWRPEQRVYDAPVACGDWKPDNYDNVFLGPISLEKSLALSRNTVAVRLSQEVGLAKVAETARRLGIDADLPNDCTLALGTKEASLLEVVAAYNVFANGGFAAEPYGLIGIRDRQGHFIYWREDRLGKRLVSEEHVKAMSSMLMQVVNEGTGKRASVPRTTVAGKTGTTNNYRDAWFVGYTPSLTTGVWVGNDDNTPMKKITGGDVPARIFQRFVINAYENLPFIGE